MINEFLCSKFVASQILEQISPHHIENRLGKPSTKMNMQMGDLDNHNLEQDANHKSRMLYDEGSFGYKNWLSK